MRVVSVLWVANASKMSVEERLGRIRWRSVRLGVEAHGLEAGSEGLA